MSKIGIPRVYWRKGAWRYMCNNRQKALVGKSWIRLGVKEDEALAEFKRWEERLFPKASMTQLFDRYEAEIIPAKPSPATRESNMNELKRLRSVFAECEIEDISVHDIYAYMAEVQDEIAWPVRHRQRVPPLSQVHLALGAPLRPFQVQDGAAPG